MSTMTFADYSTPWPIGSGRGGTRLRTGPTLWLVNHTSEGGEGLDSAENLCRFIGTPATSTNVASYHAVTDTDQIEQLVQDEYRANHAGGANEKSLGICYPGKAAQTRDQWFDAVTSGYLEQSARWHADKCLKWNIPAARVTPDQMRAGVPGICGHTDVRAAFGATTHTDPGPNFPYEWLIGRIHQLLAPPPPPPESPIVAMEPFGTFEIYDAVRWPSQVADVIYGDSSQWEKITVFNGWVGDTWKTAWPGIGGKVKVPGWPGTKNPTINGVRVRVPHGAGPAAIIGIAYPDHDTWAERSGELPELAFWNGGRVDDIAEGEIVFVRHPLEA